MIQLILIRPGCTDFDVQGRIQGTLDIPLNDAGRSEAAAAVEQLRVYLPAALYCCAGNPSEDTAAVFGDALDLKVKRLDRLTNINLGLWQGMLVEEVRHKQPKVYKQWQEHPEMVHPPQGETIAEAIERIDEALEKLARKHRSGAIVLVAPEPIASLIRRRIDGSELGDLWCPSTACRMDVLRLEPDFAVPASERAKEAAKPDPRSVYIYRGSVVERH